MPSANVIAEIIKTQQTRKLRLITLTLTDATLRYVDVEKTSVGDGSYYTYNSINYDCAAVNIPEEEGSQNIDGEFDEIVLLIQNIDRSIGAYINTAKTVNKIVNIISIYEGHTASADFISKWRYRINKGEYDTESQTARFELKSIFVEYKQEVPIYIRDRNRCGFEFDGTSNTNTLAKLTCGWNTQYMKNPDGSARTGASLDTTNYPNASATKCDKGFRSPNGCAAHFNQNDTTNRPRIRGRFYPGMPTKAIRGIT